MYEYIRDVGLFLSERGETLLGFVRHTWAFPKSMAYTTHMYDDDVICHFDGYNYVWHDIGVRSHPTNNVTIHFIMDRGKRIQAIKFLVFFFEIITAVWIVFKFDILREGFIWILER